MRRLDAESLRDRILLVSGRLDCTPFGPPVPVVEDTVGQVLPKGDSPRQEPLSPSAAHQAGLAAGGL